MGDVEKGIARVSAAGYVMENSRGRCVGCPLSRRFLRSWRGDEEIRTRAAISSFPSFSITRVSFISSRRSSEQVVQRSSYLIFCGFSPFKQTKPILTMADSVVEKK